MNETNSQGELIAEATEPGIVTWEQADLSRRVMVYGGGSSFIEADGTRYTPTGAASGIEWASVLRNW